jgi:tetratricopeptide (TPR) repeat protein
MRDSIQKGILVYRNFVNDPRNKYRDVSNEIRRTASKIGREGKLEESKILYELILSDNPTNILIQINLALLYEDLNEHEQAKTVYHNILQHINDDRQTDNYLKHYIEDHAIERLQKLK